MDLEKFFGSFKGNVEEMELNLSIDCVLFTIQDNQLKVLLTKLIPKMDWMLPGGFVLNNEKTENAATRILHQRTGVENLYLEQFKIFSDPSRFSFQSFFQEMEMNDTEPHDLEMLPKRVISIGYFALVDYNSLNVTGGDFGENTLWSTINELPKLKFDHEQIITDAVEALRKELYLKPIAYNLLPEKFTMPELQKLYEIILDKTIERSSFQKKMLKWGIYERLEERREGVAHKRPFLYRFDKEKYQQALKDGVRFGI